MRKRTRSWWIVVVSVSVCTKPVPAAEVPVPAVAPFDAAQAQQFQQQWAKHLGTEPIQTNSIGIKLVLIPPGEFMMGTTEREFAQTIHELSASAKDHFRVYLTVLRTVRTMPEHRVKITQPFCMSAHEVTVGQFRQFVEATGYTTDAEKGLGTDRRVKELGSEGKLKWSWRNVTPPGEYQYDGDHYYTQSDDEPVCHISWCDAVAFCNWLSRKESKDYHLPAEAQWEYACRAGTTTRWFFGNDPGPLGQYAWYRANSDWKFHPVGTKKPNAFGLYDMIGNVYEWCSDLYGASYYKSSPIEDPPGPEKYEEPNAKNPELRRHVLRGASSDAPCWYLRSAYRVRAEEHACRHSHLGFRVSMSVDTAVARSPECALTPVVARSPDRATRPTEGPPDIKACKENGDLRSAGGGVARPAPNAGGERATSSAKPAAANFGTDRPAASRTPAASNAEREAERAKYIRLATNLVKYEANPVLDIGKPGEWDAGGFGCTCVKKIGDTFFIWYGTDAWRIGVATSKDGIHWTRSAANPVLDKAAMPYVLKVGDEFRMWFCDRSGKRGKGERGGSYCLATSRDGIKWEEQGPVMSGYLTGFDPCVVKVGEKFYMWYVGHSGGKNGSFRISMATSGDGIKWEKYSSDEGRIEWEGQSGNPVLPLGKEGEWDDRHHAVPCVLRVGDLFFMWYLGYDGSTWRIGFATSEDGIHWTKSNKNPILDVGKKGAWDCASIMGHDVVFADNTFHMWFGGVTSYKLGKGHSPIRMGYARSKPVTDSAQAEQP